MCSNFRFFKGGKDLSQNFRVEPKAINRTEFDFLNKRGYSIRYLKNAMPKDGISTGRSK